MFRALVNRRFGFKSGVHLQRYMFGGGHAPKAFDWRDDHSLNPFYQEDPRRTGIPDSYSYGQPFESQVYDTVNVYPTSYNPKDLTQNFVGTAPLQSVAETNLLEPHHQNILDDAAHEWDYESEDLDFQPQTFKSQHFRKKGGIWIWALAALIPYWYVIQEVIYHQMVDGDQNKYQRPPPLNYPDQDDTPDTQTHQIWKSPQFNYLWDAGLLKDPYFDIVDGKKIYSKWAGVNQPGVEIKGS